jgi:hypothetical protein
MAESIFALPVSLEQIVALIKRMSPFERQQLLKFVPELRQEAMQTQTTREDAHESVEQLRRELLEELGGELLSSDEPFLDGLTLGQYLDLPDAERAKLWDKWGELDVEELEELEAPAESEVNQMPKTFEDMTPEEFLSAVNGYINREDEEIEADQFFQLATQEVTPQPLNRPWFVGASR